MNKKLILTLIPLVLIAGCTQPATTYITENYNYNQIPIQPAENIYNVQLSFLDDTVCVGNLATGFIVTNIPNGICRVWTNTGTGWNVDMDATLDANGKYTETRQANTPGRVSYKAVCCDANIKCGISNVATITIEQCANTQSSCCKYMSTYDCFVNVCPLGWNTIEVYNTDDQCHANCNAPSPSCTDTDGGNDVYHYGVCSDGTQSIQDYCQQGNSDIVNENWCENGHCMGASLYCPTGYYCWEGACVPVDSGRDCNLVVNPRSQIDCNTGLCSSGSCVYHSATVYSVPYCRCE